MEKPFQTFYEETTMRKGNSKYYYCLFIQILCKQLLQRKHFTKEVISNKVAMTKACLKIKSKYHFIKFILKGELN
jgi:hypothetical protein